MGVHASTLREGQQIFVSGKLAFSRLARVIDGAELEKRVRDSKSKFPTKTPHTLISLIDPQVLPMDPSAVTPEEQFVFEKFFTYGQGDNAGHQGLSVENIGQYLPTILEPDESAPGTYKQLVLPSDLATGLQVLVVINVYKPKDYENRGLGIDQVILQEAPRYYSGGGSTAALAARGIVVTGGIKAVQSGEPSAVAQAAAGFEQEAARSGFPLGANTSVDTNGFAMPTPGAQGVAPASPAFPQAFQQQAPVAQQQAPGFGQPAPQQQQFQQQAPQFAQPQAPIQQQFPQGQPMQQQFQQPGAVVPQAQQIAQQAQQIQELQAAQANGGGSADESAFATAPVPVGAGAPAANSGAIDPWQVPGQAPTAFQG